MTDPTGGPDVLESELCYCKNVSREDFARFCRDHRALDFPRACEKSGVGMVCTSCLLNAEVVYAEVRQQPERVVSKAVTRRRAFQWPTKAQVIEWLVRHSPSRPARFESVCPVLASDGVATSLSISNAAPAPIGLKSATFRLEVEVFDDRGRFKGPIRAIVPPGEHCKMNLSELLEAPPSGGITVGSARVALTALDRGYKGTVRPHFAFICRNGVGAVHTAAPSRFASTPVMYSVRRRAERHFLHVMNCSEVAAVGTVTTESAEGHERWERRIEFAPGGAALVELDSGLSDLAADLRWARVRSSGLLRAYFLIADANLERISVDHV